MSYSNCQFTWLKQKETLVSLAESLLKYETYFDCQICAEGHRFNVHRVILSCNSPVLSNLLQEHNSDLPVITLAGVSPTEVAALIEFMYTGVTKISPANLKTFFQTAKSLQLAGLTHYENAQVDKIINESSSTIDDSKLIDNYEGYSQSIVKYLEQSESDQCQLKDSTHLSANTESLFLDDSGDSSLVNDNSIIYEKYDSDYVKEEDGIESLDPKMVESDELPQRCENANETDDGIEAIETDTPIMYNKFHNIYIKNEDASINDSIATVYSISKIDSLSEKEDEEFTELQDEIKVTDEDKNFVYVKLDNSALLKLKDSSAAKSKQNLSKSDVQFYSEKCLKVVNPLERNYLVKRPKMQGLVTKDAKTNTEDKKIYICLKCGNKYSHRRTLLHHIHWICEQPATYSCSLCPYRGKRKFQLKSHMKHAHLLKMS